MSKDKWKNAMMKMHDWLRHKIKHSEEVVYGEMSDDRYLTFEECKAKLNKIIKETNQNKDEK